MYQTNRAIMSSNAVAELAELEARNQQTTAYPSISCVAGPMSPNYADGSPCDITAMQERSHGITAYQTNGTALLPQFNGERSLSCANMEMQGVGLGAPNPALVARSSGEPPIGYAPNVYAYNGSRGSRTDTLKPVRTSTVGVKKGGKRGIAFKTIPSRVSNSVRGVLYDMQHRSELPPAQSGMSPGRVTTFALTRDNRMPYLLFLLTVVLALVATVFVVRSATKQKS